MTDNLKPCPFCGGSNLEVVNTPQGYFIGCSCGCFTGDFETREAAVAAWNTRAVVHGEVCEIEGHGEVGPIPLTEERTCRLEEHYGDWYCTNCEEMVGSSDPWSELAIDSNVIEEWQYCPKCGAKVVSVDYDDTVVDA